MQALDLAPDRRQNTRRSRPVARGRIAVAVRALVLGLLGAGIVLPAVQAAPRAPAKSAAPLAAPSSPMDAELFYQLLVSELELRQGSPGVAYQVMLDAARRTREDALFQRAVDIAVGARAPEQALAALKAWRSSLPRSRQAAEVQTQVLMALGRFTEAQEPARSLIELTPAGDRPGVISALPRLVLPGAKATAAATALDEVLKPWQEQPATRVSALLAAGRVWALAGDTSRSLKLATEAQKLSPTAEGAALLGLELWGKDPRAEALVNHYLQNSPAPAPLRLNHVRRLTAAQRYPEALKAVEQLTSAEPAFAPGWLMHGALLIELARPAEAQRLLQRYLDLKQAGPATAAAEDDDEDPGPDLALGGDEGRAELNQAYLMLSQAAEQLKDYAGAQRWLDKLGEVQNTPAVVLRRAGLLARDGRIDEALALSRTLPERTPEEIRTRVLGEAQLLRDARRWSQAHAVLEQGNQRLPNDPDLLYEQALVAEKLARFDEMERLLLRVIELKPDQQHAYNALGYSLADRQLDLPRAEKLVRKALELTPDDPFITDSLGWVEFRLGRLEQARQLLQKAHEVRPDVEIAAHLGEVLWTMGRWDEARQVWRAALEREATNEVLNETLQRLKVRP